ncbi:MAG: hypothetical protein AAGD25_38270 [Cyanobacteria bacterium P01_F01_bin.150]
MLSKPVVCDSAKSPNSPSHWQRLASMSGLLALIALAALSTAFFYRYGDRALTHIPITTDENSASKWVGETINFEQQPQEHHFNVSFRLRNGDQTTVFRLDDIDLSLMIPRAPITAYDNPALLRWFLTEREFNRQRVVFDASLMQIERDQPLWGYDTDQLSIALTNNCLGAGYWEIAVYANPTPDTHKTVYQGYFTFPRGAYASLVSQLNPTPYWSQAPSMESWPGFKFGVEQSFELSMLREVMPLANSPDVQEQTVAIINHQQEPILSQQEQQDKAHLMMFPASQAFQIRKTWADMQQSTPLFHSFVKPGIYDAARLWSTDFSQLAKVTGAIARPILSPLTDSELLELQINFENANGEQRQLVVSGIDLEDVPALANQDYSDGVYMPLGFGTPFTQSYQALHENPPHKQPFFSVLLDRHGQVINYRKAIGINGLVLHRDIDNSQHLHLYLMSYERIQLISHYVIDLASMTGNPRLMQL